LQGFKVFIENIDVQMKLWIGSVLDIKPNKPRYYLCRCTQNKHSLRLIISQNTLFSDLVTVQNFDVFLASNGSIHGGKGVKINEQFSTTVGDNEKQLIIFEELSMPIFMVVRIR